MTAPASTSAAPDLQDTRKLLAQTPPDALAAMLESPQSFRGFTLSPVCLASIWVLQAADHPLANPTEGLRPMDPRQLAQLLFTFCRLPEARCAIARRSRPGEMMEFDRQAFAFTRRFVPLGEIGAFLVEIGHLFLAALRTAPMDAAGGERCGGLPAKSNGLGWTVTIYDLVASDYGWPGEQIATLPLSQLFLVYYAAASRREVELPGLSLAERALILARREQKAARRAPNSLN